MFRSARLSWDANTAAALGATVPGATGSSTNVAAASAPCAASMPPAAAGSTAAVVADPAKAVGLQWCCDYRASQVVIGDHQLADRPLKRAAGQRRATLGAVGRQRLSLPSAGASLGPEDAENAAPAGKQPASEPKAPVLSDVTNTAGSHHWIAKVPRPGIALASAAAVPSAAAAAASAAAPPVAPGGGLAAAGVHAGAAASVAAPTPTAAAAVSAKPLDPGVARDVSSLDFRPPPPPDQDPEASPAHIEDPQHVHEYVPDIYEHLQQEELRYLPEPNYMDNQPHVNSKMRAILVDWLVDVHKKYKLHPETLFLAIGLVDRFLERRNTARRHLQLVGVAALLIAAKFEELYPPQVQDFVYITDKAYSKEEVLRMEVSMLTVLEFQVCRPTATHFMDRFQRINGCTEAHRDLAQYLLELTLTEYRMVRYSPSHLAAAALLLSNKLLRRQPSWTASLARRTGLTEQVLRECAREICGLLEMAEASQMQAVRKKFSQQKHHAVAKLNFSADNSPHRGSVGTSASIPAASERAPATGEARKCGAAPQTGGSAAKRGSGGAEEPEPEDVVMGVQDSGTGMPMDTMSV